MADDHVVVLAWDRASRTLEFVRINGGNGGGSESYTVAANAADQVAKQCDQGLPRVGELLIDEDTCYLELNGPPARLCSVTPRGTQLRLTDPEQHGAEVDRVGPGRLGLPDLDAARALPKKVKYLWFAKPVEGIPGCWLLAGGIDGWLTERRAEKAAQEEQKATRAAAEAKRQAEVEARERRERSFINPYTFVPFPATISRESPGGHHRLAEDRLSGRLTVRWRFTSPFQAPDGSEKGQSLRLPGSSVKGALRSVHEVLAGGCLRVLDEEYLPSYRDMVKEEAVAAPWTLAVVEEVSQDGRPMSVRPCTQVVWVRASQLHQAIKPDDLKTGDRVTLPWPVPVDEKLGRRELRKGAPVSAGGNWVVLLTDAGARHADKPEYYVACGQLTDLAPIEVDNQAWQPFRRAVAGAREFIQAQSDLGADAPGNEPWEKVHFPKHELIGRRKRVTGRFATDDVLWVHPEGGRVTALRLSAIWRHPGDGPLGKRVPEDLLRCTDPDHLCPSCRLFGAADTRPRQQEEAARQRSYAGQVRFGDAVSEPVTLEKIQRAPLGTPRPGAGQFYLRYHPRQAVAVSEEDLPVREWGAKPDQPTLRPVRGRKHYWHADPTLQQPPRHLARKHQQGKLSVEKLLAPAGTVLTQQLTFDNLSPAEFGGLLAALQPEQLLPAEAPGSRPLRLHLGGGKPLGLGSCRAEVTDLTVWNAQSRYGNGGEVPVDSESYVTAFRAATDPAVRAVWPAVTEVLADHSGGSGGVDPKRVWYPPGAYWPDQAGDQKTFDEPFAFFTATSGTKLKKEGREMRPLPEPTDSDQSLPILLKKNGPRSGKEDHRR